MDSGATRVGIRRGGMSGKVFPTLDHPPNIILMGEEAWESLGMMCDVNFPQLWHQNQTIRKWGCLGNNFPHLIILPECLLMGGSCHGPTIKEAHLPHWV